MKPIVKWAGGKRSLLPVLRENIPDHEIYVEPFLGGAALFLDKAASERSVLSDKNARLINMYRIVRDNPAELTALVEALLESHNTENYYKQREKFSNPDSPLEEAAIFIYLNKTCFNGLYRVNRKDEFNVPIGRQSTLPSVDAENLREVSSALAGAELIISEFSSTLPSEGMFYYLDPPYHDTYAQYDAGGFDESEHRKLANYCGLIDNNGAKFLLSNSDTPLIRSLYKKFTIKEITVNESITRVGTGRKNGRIEVVVRNF